MPDLDQLVLRFVAWLRRLGGDGGGRGLALLGIAAVSLWLLTGFYRVQPDELGVVLRFGAYVRTTPPGLNYHLPWPVEEVLLPAVTRINRIEIGFRTAPAEGPEQNARTPDGETEPARGQPPRELSEESLMLTGDENIIDINFAVFWRIRDAVPYLFNTRNPGYTVKSAAESVMREVIGRTPIQSALTQGRASIEQAVLTGAQAILDQYGAGVEITQVQLQKVDPPAEVIESFRDVQRANTDADRARNEAQAYANDIVPRARGDAAGILGAAQGDRQATIARATGEAQRFLSVYAAYTRAKDVTLRRLYIETMQEILQHTPTVVVDDRLRSILPTLRLGPEAAPSAAPATGKGGRQ
ncbi:MAG TPA: FtsH protease activity modulator HflK [Acetobacteraceae bacterium]|nr:FtsH protease activity modulator HflK [Acetobacteraceae bacterium]